jgi:hypothetical protein
MTEYLLVEGKATPKLLTIHFNLPETTEVECIQVDKLFDYKTFDKADLSKVLQHNCCSLQQPRTSLSNVDILFSSIGLLYHKFENMMKW